MHFFPSDAGQKPSIFLLMLTRRPLLLLLAITALASLCIGFGVHLTTPFPNYARDIAVWAGSGRITDTFTPLGYPLFAGPAFRLAGNHGIIGLQAVLQVAIAGVSPPERAGPSFPLERHRLTSGRAPSRSVDFHRQNLGRSAQHVPSSSYSFSLPSHSPSFFSPIPAHCDWYWSRHGGGGILPSELRYPVSGHLH